VWRAEPDLRGVSKPTAIALDLKDEVWMTRTLYAACVAGALALAPVAASAQYVTYGAYPYAAPYAAPYAPYAYSSYWATPYSYPATARSAWGYPYWYGSNSPWTGSASASSHPAYYGGSGGYAYHPAYGFGY
jgi:hypothetical protein